MMRTDELVYRLKWGLDTAAIPFFKLRRRPFVPGYVAARQRLIASAIDRNILCEMQDLPPAYGVAMDERVVEYPWLFGRLKNVGKMLDAGSTFNHHFLLERAPLKGADLTIMTLAPEKRCYWYDGYSYVFGDLRKTVFADHTFDTIASISTIEHIGLDNTMLYSNKAADAEQQQDGFVLAVKEFRRIIKPGGNCFISFPFGRRDNLGWYQVFDLDMVDQVIQAFSPSSHRVDYFGYTRRGWSRGSAGALANATGYDVYSGKGWGDDLAAASRAIACLQLTA